jgi:hypothetical protein
MHSVECALTTQMQIGVDSSNDNVVKTCRVTKKSADSQRERRTKYLMKENWMVRL